MCVIRHYPPFSSNRADNRGFSDYPARDDMLWKWSMATAYAGLALLGFTLLVGALNVLRSRPNPTSTDLRRDAGISATLVILVHVVLGLFVHMGGNPLHYFFFPAGETHLIPLRYDPSASPIDWPGTH
jgi:hypothetical protein